MIAGIGSGESSDEEEQCEQKKAKGDPPSEVRPLVDENGEEAFRDQPAPLASAPPPREGRTGDQERDGPEGGERALDGRRSSWVRAPVGG